MSATVEAALASGLTREEFQRIVGLLGRAPNGNELGMFSAMWSEHCSYKSSKRHLARFPTESPRVLEGPGENAGAALLGEGLAVVFKVESHNHPTFIEPFQGAATGVGGILRDVFTMGARPVALMNSLRFGPLENPKNRALFAGAVAGIANYGNSMGIPTVGGEVFFEDCYSLNPLVNAFALGVAPADRIFRARADVPGSPIWCVGAKTGRDGIHGASMASASFDEEAEAKRPTVQVGDPFLEKLLMEACLELMRGDALLGVQDMGAAGITCSTAEMASRGGAGVEVDLDLVPQRESGMSAYEILLSESQERMLMAVRPGREDEVRRVFRKWDLDAAAIGRVSGDGLLRARHGGKVAAELPCRALTDDAPVLDRPVRALPPEPEVPATSLPEPTDWNEAALGMAGCAELASRRFVYEQYDHMVRSDTLVRPGGSAGVVRIKGSRLGIAMTLDGNGRWTARDPRRGGALAVSEACRNLASVGAIPIGATNCLNFSNPERPEIMWQFAEAIAGMSEALQAFGVPITGGNVSLYNETDDAGIFPTPVVGVVGALEDAGKRIGQRFGDGDALLLAGPEDPGAMGASAYLKERFGRTDGRPPKPDLAAEIRLGAFLRSAAGVLTSARDLSEGGLLAQAVESLGGRGAALDLACPGRAEGVLWGEGVARALVSVPDKRADEVLALAERAGVPLLRIGTVGGDSLRVRLNGAATIELPVATVTERFRNGLGRLTGA